LGGDGQYDLKQVWVQEAAMLKGWPIVRLLGVAVTVISIVVAVLAFSINASIFPQWTGFPDYTPSPPKVEGFERAKTLWDWMNLLLIPVALAFLAYWLNRLEKRREERQAELQAIQEEQRARQTALIEEQRFQEATLQSYLGYMTHLLLDKDLRKSQPRDEVRSVARTRTLTVLRVLDSDRKATVLQFLYDSILIGKVPEEAIIGVHRADLSGANLRGAYLKNANLSGANLSGANLSGAYMRGVDLTNAILQDADLSKAFMKNATVDKADLSHAKLCKTYLRLSSMKETKLIETNMKEVMLHGANLSDSELRGADLTGAELFMTIWSGSTVTPEQLATAVELQPAKSSLELIEPAVDIDQTSSSAEVVSQTSNK
jgi:hypothetical protein